ncbi:MAG: N-acetylmuramoyl-L-alanine amidase [Alphaproteobacteria bacterium]|nr:N-acetylmuramoyl-L-alanine amidase [Alphaproteobacteria bacterium]
MKISRRGILKVSALSVVVAGLLPRMAFAARNSLRSLRTGVQPNGKTRLVIETANRPSYSIIYGENSFTVKLSNTMDNTSVLPKLASGTLVKNVSKSQSGDTLNVVVSATCPVAEIPKSSTMILEPNGDNEYRLVLDFVAGGAAAGAAGTKGKKTDEPKKTVKKHVIVVDAGHGGKDPGCIGKGGTKEKDVVLSVTKKLQKQLQAEGFAVYLTRSGDKYLKLQERAAIGEQRRADLFLSIHANANPSRAMKGFSIYTLSEKASDEEAQKLADAENAADKIDVSGFESFSKDIRIALSSLQQHVVAEMSQEYASDCAKSFNRAGVEQQPGAAVRHAPLAVLRSTVPGALIECGHLSNASEEKLLKTSAHQDKIVAAIVRSVKNYNFDV